MIKTTYFRLVLRFFSKGILFSFFIYLLFQRTDTIDLGSFQITSYFSLIGCLLLTPLNWFIEWMKWKEILVAIKEKENPNNLTAFASGIVTSFLTPSLSGNFIGRMFYYEKSKRWKITGHSIVANFSQFLISVVVGLFALQFTPSLFDVKNWGSLLIWAFTFLLLALFFFGEKILKNFPINKLQSLMIQVDKGPSRLRIFFLSFLRYFIFIAQYVLALSAFGERINFTLLCLIAVIFLLITLTPSLFFGKIIVRESIAVFVFSYVGMGPLPAAFASFTTWLFNLLFPAMIALIFVKNKK